MQWMKWNEMEWNEILGATPWYSRWKIFSRKSYPTLYSRTNPTKKYFVSVIILVRNENISYQNFGERPVRKRYLSYLWVFLRKDHTFRKDHTPPRWVRNDEQNGTNGMIEMKWSAGKFTGGFWEKITPSEKILVTNGMTSKMNWWSYPAPLRKKWRAKWNEWNKVRNAKCEMWKESFLLTSRIGIG